MTSGGVPSYRGRVRGLAIGALFFVGACSLQGLDDLTPPYTDCDDDGDCQPLNDRDAISEETCERWYCAVGFCRLRTPGALEETCNGADDDCDALIDESGGEPESVAQVLVAPASLTSIEARPEGGATAVFLDAPAESVWRATIVGSGATTAIPASFATSDTGASAPSAGCVGAMPTRACAIRSVSFAHVDGELHVVAARVAREGDGPLRIGPVVDESITLSGTDARSSLWRGLDASEHGALGAMTIASARSDRERVPSALLGVALPEAAGGARVGLLGVWVERDPSGLRWAHAAGAGEVTLAGALLSDVSSPSVTALDGGRWLVAFPTESSALATVLVAALPEPAARCAGAPTAACVSADDQGLVTQVPVGAVEPRTSGAMVIAAEGMLPIGASPVVIAAGRTVDATQIIALAYLEDDELVLVLGGVRDASISLGDPQRIAAAGARDLSVTYAPEGLRTGAERGGFVLAWSTSDGTFVARVPDAAPTPLLSYVGEPSASPRAFIDDAERVAVVAGQEDRLVVFPHACGPRR